MFTFIEVAKYMRKEAKAKKENIEIVELRDRVGASLEWIAQRKRLRTAKTLSYSNLHRLGIKQIMDFGVDGNYNTMLTVITNDGRQWDLDNSVVDVMTFNLRATPIKFSTVTGAVPSVIRHE
jgi:hypothetical protein